MRCSARLGVVNALPGVTLATAACASIGSTVAAATQPFAARALFIYGGDDNRVFLGCLNCNEVDASSVNNQIGRFGSSISPSSIRNPISQYGSSISPYSVCSPIASHAPVVVDQAGNFYGRLTMNEIAPDRIQSAELHAWLAGVCAGS